MYREYFNDTVLAKTSPCCCEFLFVCLAEVVTRLSPLCCENMAQSGAISEIFVLIRSCNRSVPCMEVISYAVHVLLNVAKVFPTSGTEGAALAGTRGSAIRCIFTYHWTPDPK